MSRDDFVDILKRKRIKLTLRTASYFGVLERVNSNRTLILTNVVDVKDGRSFPGTKLFFGRDIVNLEFCGETKGDNGYISVTESSGILSVEEFQPYKNSFIFDKNGEDDSEYVNFEVVDDFNEKFGPAVMHIKKQHAIGLAADGLEAFQHGRLCWLQIATKSRVYLFDILLLGAQAFKSGLSMILQSMSILKVMHDCRGPASGLLAQFGVTLTNVFDTQVADVMCFHSDTGGFLPDRVSTLQEVVTLYLKVPASRLSSLQTKSQLTKEERQMWCVRPCPKPVLKVMALKVIHLQPLRLVLLDTLMRDYTAQVDSYLSGMLSRPGDVEHIAMSSMLELPRELRGLEHNWSERQRVAARSYKVTETGLLDRYNPLTDAPPKATPPPTTLPMTTHPCQTPPKATPPPQTPPITMDLLKTSPVALEASLDHMGPRIQAAAHHIPHHMSHHAQPPSSTPALGPLHIQIPPSSPQVTRVPSLHSTALPPPAWAPSSNPSVLGPAHRMFLGAVPGLARGTVAPRDPNPAGVLHGDFPAMWRGQLNPCSSVLSRFDSLKENVGGL